MSPGESELQTQEQKRGREAGIRSTRPGVYQENARGNMPDEIQQRFSVTLHSASKSFRSSTAVAAGVAYAGRLCMRLQESTRKRPLLVRCFSENGGVPWAGIQP